MSPILLHRFDKQTGPTSVDVLIAFCSTAEINVRALADEVEEEIARALAPDELILLVRDTSLDQAREGLRTSTQGEALLERLAGRTRVEVVGYDGGGAETRREELGAGGKASAVTLEEIMRRGATAIFRRRGGFVEASRSYHFANPSGAHTDRFMRLSNILVRQAEIAFLAVALLRRLPPDARRAYIDTPALYAVVSAVNEQWRTLRDDGATMRAATGFAIICQAWWYGLRYREERLAALSEPVGAPRLPERLRPGVELKEHQLAGLAWMQHLLAFAEDACTPNAQKPRAVGPGAFVIPLVAGTGFEPVTFRL